MTSPLKRHLPNKHTRRSTHGLEQETDRPAEVYETDTPCSSSRDSSSDGGSILGNVSPGTIIECQTCEQEEAWDSEVDRGSDTSTPSFKRGHHGKHNQKAKADMGVPLWKVKQAQKSSAGSKRHETQAQKGKMVGGSNRSVSDQEARASIITEGLQWKLPDWVQQCKVQRSVLVLADSQFRYWPEHDKVFRIEYHPRWPLNRWQQAIKEGIIKLGYNTVVIYLEGTKRWNDGPPLKTCCRVSVKPSGIWVITQGYLWPTTYHRWEEVRCRIPSWHLIWCYSKPLGV